MGVRPKPFTIVCTHCRWLHTFHPRSDALRVGIDIVTECPQCGSVDLERRRPTLFEAARLALAASLKRYSL